MSISVKFFLAGYTYVRRGFVEGVLKTWKLWRNLSEARQYNTVTWSPPQYQARDAGLTSYRCLNESNWTYSWLCSTERFPARAVKVRVRSESGPTCTRIPAFTRIESQSATSRVCYFGGSRLKTYRCISSKMCNVSIKFNIGKTMYDQR
jgi:hypothetical protein